jgi:N-methylhydantoinase A
VPVSFAVDVGGTFTDLVLFDPQGGGLSFTKAPTTPDDPSLGVIVAIEKSGLQLDAAERFFHGTTLGINAMLEQKGARAGLITTRGFRDVLELRRLSWPMYRMFWQAPQPLIPRALRREVTERVRADGVEVTPLDEDELCSEVELLVSKGVDTIAVCFLHAYAHPGHEQRASELITERFRDVTVTLSHHVTREYREYERTATTVADAAIKRRMSRYVDSLEERLHGARFSGAFLMTRCDGGVMSASQAKARPIRTLISGPASGVMGAVALGRWLEVPNIIGGDMGGTSFDASLIVNHEPSLNTITEVNDLPLLMPVIELATIGAGGGSIAWLDGGGALTIGPQSAGAEPGPACYGLGGTEPTFTDAALVSGLISPSNFLGGEISLDFEAAREAVRIRIAEPLGFDVGEAAAGIVQLSEAKMAGALDELTVAKGHDPRDFNLLAFGGGGSLVASALMTRLSIGRVIVPPSPATFSAWGMLTLDVVHDLSRTLISPLELLEGDDIREIFDDLLRRAADALRAERVPADRQLLQCFIDVRYESQEHVLTLPLGSSDLTEFTPEKLRWVFEERHDLSFGYRLPDDPVEVTAYRIRAAGRIDKPSRPSIAKGVGADAARVGARWAYNRESGAGRDWALYRREALGAGDRLAGPAIVEEQSATTVVAPNNELVVDELGNMLITQT